MARRPTVYIMLDKMNVDQLTQARSHIDALIAQKRADSRKRLIDTMHVQAKKQGFDINELFGKKTVGRPGGSAGVKYRHPKDPSLTWSGRGRQTKWLADLVAKGHNREDYAI